MHSWSRQQIVLCQAIQAPNSKWLDSNSLWTRHVQENKSTALMQSLLIIHSMILLAIPIFELGSTLVTRILNQTTRGQTLWRSIHLETDIITCRQHCRNSHSSLLPSVMHVNHTHFSTMQADTSKKVTVIGCWRCKHYMVIASSQAGQVKAQSLFCRPNMHICTWS